MKNEISIEVVKHVAQLACLTIQPEEEKQFEQHMNLVISYVELLDEIDTSDTKPFFSPANEHRELYSAESLTHKDVIRPSLGVDEILRNAPSKYLNQFAVETVIEEN